MGGLLINKWAVLKLYSENNSEEFPENTPETKSSSDENLVKNNDIMSFELVSQTTKEVVISVKYKYSGDHGEEGVYVGAVPDPRYFRYVPDKAKIGNNTATIELILAPPNNSGLVSMNTKQISIFMFIKGQKRFYEKKFPLNFIWKP
jgi:hypothetical protein